MVAVGMGVAVGTAVAVGNTELVPAGVAVASPPQAIIKARASSPI